MPAGVVSVIAHFSSHIELVYLGLDHLSEMSGDLINGENHQFFHIRSTNLRPEILSITPLTAYDYWQLFGAASWHILG